MASEQEENATGADMGESPLITVAKFPLLWDDVDERVDDLTMTEPNESLTKQEIEKELGVSSEIASEIANVCSSDTLKLGITPKQKMDNHYAVLGGQVPKGGEQLQTVRLRAAQFKRSGTQSQNMQSRAFYYEWDDAETSDPQSPPATLLTVAVGISNKLPPGRRMTRHDRELLVHADLPLTALKDKLVCPLDLVFLCGECSENPETAEDMRAQDQFKSSFFFIENVFYNDMRETGSTDMSKSVRDWLNQGRSNVITGPVHCSNMEDTTFNDLSVRLGYPYLYVHQGDCEHVITFTDIRFMHNKDCPDLEQYPLLTNQSVFYKIPCNSCKIMTAKWMTQDDALAPTDPCFFCDICYYKFHYDSKGTKIGTFRAYRHIDPSIFR